MTRAVWSDAHLVAAVLDGLLLGSAKTGPNPPAKGVHVGTASFLVSAAARGRGIGRALAEYVVDWHRELGFTVIGTVPEAFRRPDGSYVGLHVMHLSLV